MITNKHLLLERPNRIGGIQRIYRFADGHGLSVVNSPMLHSYPFAWEIAVVNGVDDSGSFDNLDYSTPLTKDVEVFADDKDANEFIERAAAHFSVTRAGA
jgi:hypothetical protein